MKDWAVSLIAAALLIGLVLWCARIFIWSFYELV
jgi:hypothetical protein